MIHNSEILDMEESFVQGKKSNFGAFLYPEFTEEDVQVFY